MIRLQHTVPLASHMYCPQFLNEDVPEERELGIAVGLVWAAKADLRVFYADRGWSSGMKHARDWYDKEGLSYEVRRLADPNFSCMVRNQR